MLEQELLKLQYYIVHLWHLPYLQKYLKTFKIKKFEYKLWQVILEYYSLVPYVDDRQQIWSADFLKQTVHYSPKYPCIANTCLPFLVGACLCSKFWNSKFHSGSFGHIIHIVAKRLISVKIKMIKISNQSLWFTTSDGKIS